MKRLTAHVIFGQHRLAVTPPEEINAPLVVPSGSLTIEFDAESLPDSIWLDGRTHPLILNESRTKGYLVLDTSRSVGFHHIQLSGFQELTFATQDAKLKLDGIGKLLDYIGAEGLSWGGQLYFSDGTAIRHHKIDYAWLINTAPRIIAIAADIAACPHRRVTILSRLKRPESHQILSHATFRLLRRNSKRFLERHEKGHLAIEGVQYTPRAAVVRERVDSYNTLGNQRFVWLLNQCVAMAESLYRLVPKQQRDALAGVLSSLHQALDTHPFSHLSSGVTRLADRPAPEEVSDERYQASFQLYEELSSGLNWLPGLRLTPRFAFVGYADEIYQAFVALALARAFDTKLMYPSLMPQRDRPCFASSEYELYYDTGPPKHLFSNWRDTSSRPAEMRPDLILVHRRTNGSLMLDAKYRVADQRAHSSALADCQVYMHSYSRNVMAVCYPGLTQVMHEVTGDGKTIIEIPVSPSPNLHEFLAKVVRPRLEAVLERCAKPVALSDAQPH